MGLLLLAVHENWLIFYAHHASLATRSLTAARYRRHLLSDYTNRRGTAFPVVYIIHDVRDGVTTQALRALLSHLNIRTLTAAEDSNGCARQPPKYSAEWRREVVSDIAAATDVICIVTAHSIDCPALFFEAGMASATRADHLISLFSGDDTTKFASGPFREARHFDSDVDSLTTLIEQLLRHAPAHEVSRGEIREAVLEFRTRTGGLRKASGAPASLTPAARKGRARKLEQSSAKLFDDLKNMFRDI